ncbi:MAG: metal-dependent phosphohydrolase [Gemmatimonadota bacterium]
MNSRALNLYIWSVCMAAAATALLMDWETMFMLKRADLAGFATLLVLAVVAESQAVTIRVGRNAGGNSIAFLPLLTIVVLFGPASAVLAVFFNGVVAEHFIRRKELQRAVFNVGQLVLSTAIAGLTYQVSGGEALMALPGSVGSSAILAQLGPFILFGVVFLVLNNTAVAGAIALSQGLELHDVWVRLVGRAGNNLFSDLLIGPIAIAVAALYMQIHIPGLLLIILPLFFIRRSYLTALQLQQANRDLLKALVKAIETRDPYTSGHSLRVSHLARSIAQVLELDGASVDEIESAALLHDVGKIEAVYTDIIAKPDSLTPEERKVIESHVTKGEELLRNLSSVPEAVILAVRHHHEREDGSGYPDGLRGSEIPVGSQIISVCDAVDAMLSDRPYRKALSVAAVLQQLAEHSGRQFNSRVVDALLESNLIGEYADIMRASSRASATSMERLSHVRTRPPRRRAFPWARGA